MFVLYPINSIFYLMPYKKTKQNKTKTKQNKKPHLPLSFLQTNSDNFFWYRHLAVLALHLKTVSLGDLQQALSFWGYEDKSFSKINKSLYKSSKMKSCLEKRISSSQLQL